jgi:hypothetical protein
VQKLGANVALCAGFSDACGANLSTRSHVRGPRSRMVKKLKLPEKRPVIPSWYSLAARRGLGFLGPSRAPIADRRAEKGDLWSGHVSLPTSLEL